MLANLKINAAALDFGVNLAGRADAIARRLTLPALSAPAALSLASLFAKDAALRLAADRLAALAFNFNDRADRLRAAPRR